MVILSLDDDSTPWHLLIFFSKMQPEDVEDDEEKATIMMIPTIKSLDD